MYNKELGGAYSVSAENKSTKANLYGVICRTTASGLMTQETMLNYAMYFVRHLPESQGMNWLPVILFLGGHSSRWDVAALMYLMKHKVFPSFIASHISVWDQPNDAGPNIRIHKCMETGVTKLGL